MKNRTVVDTLDDVRPAECGLEDLAASVVDLNLPVVLAFNLDDPLDGLTSSRSMSSQLLIFASGTVRAMSRTLENSREGLSLWPRRVSGWIQGTCFLTSSSMPVHRISSSGSGSN